MSEPRCAYLVSTYPSVTHSFVLTEVLELRRQGVRVETASVRRVGPEQLLSPEQRAEGANTFALRPVRKGLVLRSHARALACAPGAFARTLVRALRQAPGLGARDLLWQLFYFAEAMLLWDWMRGRDVRHVRVHHANVSADVAMLACAFANAAGAQPRWTWSITLHGPTELADVRAHKLALKARDADAVACTSDFMRSQITALVGDERNGRIRTVRCGIDVTAFRPRSGDGDGVLCVAALSRRKGHAVLLDAMAQLDRPARLTLVGDGPERASLEAQAERLGIDVEFAGAVGYDRVPEYFARAGAFCLPSFAEGVPTVLMEAMAAGLPVVATNVMGTAELVEDGRSGFVVAPARADLLAAAIGRLLDDPELRARMGRAGRERVTTDFELSSAVTRLRDFVMPLLTA